MKQYITLLLFWGLLLTACNDKDLPPIVPVDRGTVTDNQGNVYKWVRLGNLDWTTSNAKNGTPLYELTYFDGWSYQNAFDEEEIEDLKKNYFPIFGNLMTYADAMNSAPDGWRLPTDEDWNSLEQILGLTRSANIKGWRGDDLAFLLQQEEGGTELGLKLGGVCTWIAVWGWMELQHANFKEFGYYWTSTVDPSYTDIEAAYYRKLCVGRGSVERQCGRTDKLMSVRWVRDRK